MRKRILQNKGHKRKGFQRIASAAMAFCLFTGLTACGNVVSGNVKDLMKGIEAQTVQAA